MADNTGPILGGIFTFTGLAVAAVIVLGGKRSAPTPDTTIAPPVQVAPVPPPVPQLTPIQKLQAIPTFAGALIATIPMMTDARNDTSPGAEALTIWGIGHMKWSDVAVTKDETSIALVKKDSDEARGKRVCYGGSLIQIEVVKDEWGKSATGLLVTNDTSLIHFSAVGSTGDLVAQSPARICGVVIGKYDYSNSGGGVGHAVQVVGMFDLPANRAPK